MKTCPLLCYKIVLHSRCFLFTLLFLSEICFWISLLYPPFLFFSVWHHYPHLQSHLFILFLTLSSHSVRSEREAGGSRGRPEIDVGPAHTESGSWLNRSDRSGTEHLLCQTAGPLWMEIISKLLQEADACQKMLSVKVRLPQRCLAPSFSLSLCHTFAFFIFLNSSAFIFHCFFFSPARGFL